MKNLLLALTLLVPFGANAVDWAEHPYDKATHIAIGGAVSCAVTHYSQNPWYGVLAGLAMGAVKEATDQNFDGADLASWGVGGAVGALCINF